MLELAVELGSEVWGQVDVDATANRPGVGDGDLIQERTVGIGKTAIEVHDLIAAKERVTVGVKTAVVLFDFDAAKEVALAGEPA